MDAPEQELVKTETVAAPISGDLRSLTTATAPAFAQKALGEGVVILPACPLRLSWWSPTPIIS